MRHVDYAGHMHANHVIETTKTRRRLLACVVHNRVPDSKRPHRLYLIRMADLSKKTKLLGRSRHDEHSRPGV